MREVYNERYFPKDSDSTHTWSLVSRRGKWMDGWMDDSSTSHLVIRAK